MASSSTTIAKKVTLLLLNTSFLFLFLLFFLKIQYLNPIIISSPNFLTTITSSDACAASLRNLTDSAAKCSFIQIHQTCRPKGYINYLLLFYCHLGHSLLLGHFFLLLWLLLLFYLLGNTAADYFCPSLEGLSKTLKLSPTIAGITLLSLGNGAPDVFASIISFTRSGDADVGLNSVLGGAFFVSSAVVGVISIAMSSNPNTVPLDKTSFIRDVSFFLVSLSCLIVILVAGRINFLGALFFFSIYIFYVCSVSATHVFYRNDNSENQTTPTSDDDYHAVPLLGYVDDGDNNSDYNISHNDYMKLDHQHDDQYEIKHQKFTGIRNFLKLVMRLLELPLTLPRRATIPMVTEEEWSKPYAVISVSLAPILLSFLCNTQREHVDSRTALVTYMTAVLIGLVLGNLSYVTTNQYGPPKQCLFPWLVGGFMMSVTWTYIVAEELVSLLISLGSVYGVSPSVLGLTVLAWGNSLGDLIANVAMAVRGGPDGAQIAMAACYAGPMFNTVVGVGFSLVLSAWSEYPSVYAIPKDRSLYETTAFLMGGLLWALVVLPKNRMRLDRLLGCGLLAIYSCFLFVRLVGAFGFIGLANPNS
ncbi:Cation/calcium exchanger 4 [Morus notabilis]|uniref:Cation/calcium exchanger 4 n=1 Tax=Morus notabilis TaxID=981085 RepID=W9RF65_9ROSA|nr:cation/calcium exchanger 1 [Morus notabilis]EXB68041.1 Cation/calcium exchanger 4 [Morus notabilis]